MPTLTSASLRRRKSSSLAALSAAQVYALIQRRSRPYRPGQRHGPRRTFASGWAWRATCTSTVLGMPRRLGHLSELLKKDVDWCWETQHQDAFDAIKESLQQAPVLALPDESNAFSVVCDASDYAIGCALLQVDDDGHERVISFQSRQLKAAERNYPVYDKELL